MSREDDSKSWINRLKHYLKALPKNNDDVIRFLREAHLKSNIDTETLTMIESVILFSQLKVRDIMLPKNQMISIEEDAKLNEIIDVVTQSGHSRFPVTDSKNEVIGILHAKDLLRFQTKDNAPYDINDIVRKTSFVPESKRLDLLLAEFQNNRNHMAIVVDEYGKTSGFITLEDIIEQIIGDIEDEFDIDEEAYIKSHKDGQYIIKAHMPIDDFNEQLKANFSDASYDTIGGIVMTNFGYLPKRGETITIDKFAFKIINADARRIKLLECIDLRPSEKQNDNGNT